jgi:large subunit ribosomal protein L13
MYNKTTLTTPATASNNWVLVDATDKAVGRLATRIAMILQGKSKPEYTPYIDTGDNVVIINAEKVAMTGDKSDKKVYRHHTLYPGGLKEIEYQRMLKEHPERILKLAVQRMLPKTKMGKKMFKKLFVYAGPEHPHQAQAPVATDVIGGQA